MTKPLAVCLSSGGQCRRKGKDPNCKSAFGRMELDDDEKSKGETLSFCLCLSYLPAHSSSAGPSAVWACDAGATDGLFTFKVDLSR